MKIEWQQEGEVFKSDCEQYECRPSIWPYMYEGKDLLKPYWLDNGTWRPICTLIKSRLAKKVCEDHKAFLIRKQARLDAGEKVNVIKVGV